MTAFTSTLTDSILPSEGRRNLVINPSFETNTTSWQSIVSATITRITTDSLYGSACLQVDAISAGASGCRYISPNIIKSAGQIFTASGFVKAKTIGDVGKVIVLHLNENGGGESTQSVTLTNAWQQVSVTRTIISNSTNGFIIDFRQDAGVAVGFLLDGNLLELSNSLGSYFDGSISPAVWEDVAHASISLFATGFIKAITRFPNDTISTIESIFRQINKFSTESITLMESFSPLATLARILTDTINPSETIVKALQRSISDSIALGESFSVLATKIRSLTENITLIESLSKQFNKTYLETLTLIEIFAKAIVKNIYEQVVIFYLLTEDGFYLLTEDGGRIILNKLSVDFNEIFIKSIAKMQIIDAISPLEFLSKRIFKIILDQISFFDKYIKANISDSWFVKKIHNWDNKINWYNKKESD